MAKEKEENSCNFSTLKNLVKVLREECPWDRKQTLTSLRAHTLEETHEVLEAIHKAALEDDWQPLKYELGDLLFQVAFYARIAEERGKFDLDDVVQALIEKMVYRHPHVFDEKKNLNELELSQQWHRLKKAEQAEKNSLMDGIPPLPALKLAQKQQERASHVGFDWPSIDGVVDKIREELDEFLHEFEDGNQATLLEEEFGDVLFSLVNLGRKLGLDAELALITSCNKFSKRFRKMEQLAKSSKMNLDDMDPDQLEGLYLKAKTSMDS